MTTTILTGSLAYDRIMDFPDLFVDQIVPENIHKLSVSFNIESLEERHGGTAGNIGYALSLFGETPLIVASAGNDFGPYAASMQDNGIDISGIEIHDDIKTAVAHIMSDRENNQITSFFMGAMARPTTRSLSTIPADTVVVLSPGNKEDMLRYKQEATNASARVVVDPGQTMNWLSGDELRALIADCFICIVNDYEYGLLKQKTGMTDQEIKAACELLIITKGKEGSTIYTRNETLEIPAAGISTVLDTTGAGDAYRAGLLHGLHRGLSIADAAHIGALTAAYAVEHYGTQTFQFSLEEFCERFAETFSTPCPLAPKK